MMHNPKEKIPNYFSEGNPINDLPVQMKQYVNLRLDLFGMVLLKKLFSGISLVVMIAIVAFTSLFFLVFTSYSFILWFADYYGNASTGAFIVSGFYLAITLIVIIFRKPLIFNPMEKVAYSQMDIKEFHRETVVEPIKGKEDYIRELEALKQEMNDLDSKLDSKVEEIKGYYSFDSIKDRFVDDVFSNPKPIISTLMQAILAYRATSRKKSK